MKRKGFTLVELLVVIAIIALLMGILMPALAEVRRMAYRVLCGSNLRGISNAFGVYSTENDGDYPRAGGKGSTRIGLTSASIGADWAVKPVSGTPPAGQSVEEYVFKGNTPPRATISSSLYYLIKYSSTSPKQFVCKGDVGAKVFDLAWYSATIQIDELAYAWDFGLDDGDDETPLPGECVSYAYHLPYNHQNKFFGDTATYRGYPLYAGLNPSAAVLADRNPYLDKNVDYIEGIRVDEIDPSWDSADGELIDNDKTLNSACHGRDGQNVLFIDGHTEFEKKPNCAIEKDNIYKFWIRPNFSGVDAEHRQFGTHPFKDQLKYGTLKNATTGPKHEQDSCLLNEYNAK
ncbi:MAG: type II secretion system protein [Sedimentisphaerales bacterium]|nr:type II secretion system protein [Sedimentisphaerales bacterium]